MDMTEQSFKSAVDSIDRVMRDELTEMLRHLPNRAQQLLGAVRIINTSGYDEDAMTDDEYEATFVASYLERLISQMPRHQRQPRKPRSN